MKTAFSEDATKDFYWKLASQLNKCVFLPRCSIMTSRWSSSQEPPGGTNLHNTVPELTSLFSSLPLLKGKLKHSQACAVTLLQIDLQQQEQLPALESCLHEAVPL